MNSFSDRKLEKFLDGLQAAIEDHRAAITAWLATSINFVHTDEFNEKSRCAIADANQKKGFAEN